MLVTLTSSFFMGEETAPGFEGMRRLRHMSPVPTARLARFFNFAKKSRRVTLADSFFMGRESASGFEGMRRLRHMSPAFNARSARFFIIYLQLTLKNTFEASEKSNCIAIVPGSKTLMSISKGAFSLKSADLIIFPWRSVIVISPLSMPLSTEKVSSSSWLKS